jgi:hypothetical protein
MARLPKDGCGKKFKSQSVLTSHMSRLNHGAGRKYVCEEAECGKTFANVSNLVS